MKYLIIGGDERTVFLARMLAADKNEVLCHALEMSGLDCVENIEEACPADCVILPLPAVKDGFLNAPLSDRKITVSELARIIPEGSTVCAGMPSPEMCDLLSARKIAVHDYAADEAFAVYNAAVTAEGAVSLLMQSMRKTLFGSRVLVVGYGRIGRLLTQKLAALGVKTYILTRNAGSKAYAESAGINALSVGTESAVLSAFDAVINTAPAEMISSLAALKKSCVLIELASYPYGLDRAEAARLGLRCTLAAGLPAKYAPMSAAQVIYKNILRCQNG